MGTPSITYISHRFQVFHETLILLAYIEAPSSGEQGFSQKADFNILSIPLIVHHSPNICELFTIKKMNFEVEFHHLAARGIIDQNWFYQSIVRLRFVIGTLLITSIYLLPFSSYSSKLYFTVIEVPSNGEKLQLKAQRRFLLIFLVYFLPFTSSCRI